MDAVSRTSSNSIDIPSKKKTSMSDRLRQPSQFEYNAGLDQFVPSSPPDELKRAYKAVDRFFEGLADWIDPQGAKTKPKR